MKRIIKSLNAKDILLLHNLVIDATDGSHGISDYKLFESTVQSPFATFVGQEMYPTILEKAAALLHSLLTKPVFIDKNGKNAAVNANTAILSCAAFLELNGYRFIASPEDIRNLLNKTKKEKITVDQAIEWIQANSQKV